MNDTPIPIKKQVNKDKKEVARYELEYLVNEVADKRAISDKSIEALKNNVAFQKVVKEYVSEEVNKRFMNNITFWVILFIVTVVGLLIGSYISSLL